MRTRLRLLSITAVSVLALAACSGGTSTTPTPTEGEPTSSESQPTETAPATPTETAAPSEPLKVSVAVLAPGSLQWLHAIAEDQGFYSDRNLTVESIQVQNSGALVQAVASGSANAGIALGDNVIKAVDEGAEISITGALFQRPALRLFAAPGVATIEELAGKQLTAGAVEGGTTNLMFYILQENGIDWKSVTPVAIPNSSDRVVAMGNGQVQGALLIPPFDSVAVSQGATMLATYDDYYIQTPAIVNNAWAAQNPEAAAAFTQGLAEAADWIYEQGNRDDAVRILVDYTGVEESAAEDAYDFMVGDEIISPGLEVPLQGLTNVAMINAEILGGDISAFDPEKYVDLQYLNK